MRDIHERDIETNRRMKAHDAAERFFSRFYEIEKEKREQKQLSDFYYEQIYGLHFDEFITYTDGFLDKDLYATWLRYRWHAYHANEREENSHWDRVKRTHHIVDPRFIEFMNTVLDAPKAIAIQPILDKLEVKQP